MATDTQIADIKARTDIVDLIERDLGPPEKTSGRWSLWRCPFHREDTPSFGATPDTGSYYCFGCGKTGDAISWLQDRYDMTFPEAVEHLGGNGVLLPQTVVADRAQRQRIDTERKQAALDVMAAKWSVAHRYHAQMTDRSYWHGQGLTDQSIDRWNLGWTPECPTFRQSPSHTIPITAGGKLLNIRHRLTQPQSRGDKYRPQMAGLPALMFGYDLCKAEPVLMLVEGEVKAMLLTQEGFPAVGIPGASTFKPHWVSWFADVLEVFVAFDPGAETQAAKVCEALGNKAKLVTLPVKPDDFFVRYGGTRRLFTEFINAAR